MTECTRGNRADRAAPETPCTPPARADTTGRWTALVPWTALVGLMLLVGACAEDQPDQPDQPDLPATTTSAPTTTTTTPITVGSVDPDRIPVYVVTDDVAAGTPAEVAVEQGLLEESSLPFIEFPEDAVVTLDLLSGKVAADDIPAGTVLVAGMFVDPDAWEPEPGTPGATSPSPTGEPEEPAATGEASGPTGTGPANPVPGR